MAEAEEVGLYTVTWRYNNLLQLVDFDDAAEARRLAQELAEFGDRAEILVSGPQVVAVDTARKELLRERIMRAVRSLHIAQLVREAQAQAEAQP